MLFFFTALNVARRSYSCLLRRATRPAYLSSSTGLSLFENVITRNCFENQHVINELVMSVIKVIIITMRAVCYNHAAYSTCLHIISGNLHEYSLLDVLTVSLCFLGTGMHLYSFVCLGHLILSLLLLTDFNFNYTYVAISYRVIV